jgi:hypothetical protein
MIDRTQDRSNSTWIKPKRSTLPVADIAVRPFLANPG